MLRWFQLYPSYFWQYVKRQMAYRANFWIEAGSYLLWICSEVALIYFIGFQVKELQGWTLPQLLLMYALSLSAVGCFFTVGVNLFFLPGEYILEGNLDRLMLRPMDPYGQLLMERISGEDTITLLTGLGLTFYALHWLGVPINLITILMVLAHALGGGMIFLGLMTMAGSLSFVLKDRWGMMHMFLTAADQLGSYPINIYPPLARTIMTFIVPSLSLVSIRHKRSLILPCIRSVPISPR
ncbi:MAG: ABC-2 family transporter protein [bacterium]